MNKGENIGYLNIKAILHKYAGKSCVEYACDGAGELHQFIKMIASFIRFLKKKENISEGDILGQLIIEIAKMEAKERQGDFFVGKSSMAKVDGDMWKIINNMMNTEKGEPENGNGKE